VTGSEDVKGSNIPMLNSPWGIAAAISIELTDKFCTYQACEGERSQTDSVQFFFSSGTAPHEDRCIPIILRWTKKNVKQTLFECSWV